MHSTRDDVHILLLKQNKTSYATVQFKYLNIKCYNRDFPDPADIEEYGEDSLVVLVTPDEV